MCKKASLLVTFVLVLSLINSQSAYGVLVWWSDMDPATHSWSSADNWVYWDDDSGEVLIGHEPNSPDVVYIGKGVLEAYWPEMLSGLDNVNRRPVIEPNSVTSCYALWGPAGYWDQDIGWEW